MVGDGEGGGSKISCFLLSEQYTGLSLSSFFNFILIGLEAWDSCYSATVATDRSISFLGDRKVSYEQNVGDNCGSQLKAGMSVYANLQDLVEQNSTHIVKDLFTFSFTLS